MKPSDRIHELTRLAAILAMELEGTASPARAEALLEDPRLYCIAIVQYLDEEKEGRDGH